MDSAETLLQNLFFDPRRYDLSTVGRYKFNKKLTFWARAKGRKLAMPVADPATGEILFEDGHVLTADDCTLLDTVGVPEVSVTLDSGETALLIMDVTPGGPGDEAGLREGDLLLKADGEALTKSADLLRIRRRHDAGDSLALTYERDGKRSTVNVILRESDAS